MRLGKTAMLPPALDSSVEIAYNVTHIRVRDEKFVGEMAMSRDG